MTDKKKKQTKKSVKLIPRYLRAWLHPNAFPVRESPDDFTYYCPDCGETGD